MNVLFITSSRIGDAVLSTGLLHHILAQSPEAKVTIACGPLCVTLFEGFPNLEIVYPVKKEKMNKHWFKLWKRVIGKRWDIVVDLRDSAVSRLIFVKKRYIFSRHIDKAQHKVKQNADVMGLTAPPAPKLWFSQAQMKKARTLIPDGGKVLGVGPTANWIGKTWVPENFIEITNFLTAKGQRLEGARVAVFAAPGEEENAFKVLNAVPENLRLDVIAKTDPGTAAAALSLCDFYIGNDSGLMHCAAAAGVPTLGVFGPSYPHIYAPYGDHTDFVRTPETFDELIDFDGYDPKTLDRNLMNTIDINEVKEAALKLLDKTGA